jgi:hypothetical protein
VLWRVDRVGWQIEAVSADIRAEVAELLANEDRANETLREWKENRQQAAKETRQMLIFWGVVIASCVGWQVIKSRHQLARACAFEPNR